MMIPPTSSRKAVRLRNASSLTGLSSVYTFLIATWISASPSSSKDTPNPRWLLGFRSKLLALGQEIQTIRGLTELARWEGSVRGAWPADEYRRLVDVQSGMIASLAQVCRCSCFVSFSLNVHSPAWWRHRTSRRRLAAYIPP